MGCVQSSSGDENEPTERLAAKSVYTRRGSELRYRDFDSSQAPTVVESPSTPSLQLQRPPSMSRSKSVDISDIFVKAWFDDYDYMEMLGSGDFGLVVRVREKKTGAQYAMKIIDREWAAEKCASEEAFRIERRILQIVNHTYIVELRTSFETEHFYFFVMELVRGSLTVQSVVQQHLNQQTAIAEPIARFWCAEIVEAISYLHTQLGIVWRDCKPDNVMIDAEGHVKLIDFGVSALLTLPASSDASATNPQTRIVTGAHRRHQSSITLDQVDEKLQPVEGLTGAIGAMGYRAPEMMIASMQPYRFSVDWFNVGVLLHVMLTGKHPFRSTFGDYNQNVKSGAEPKLSVKLTDTARDLISKLLLFQPDQRLGCQNNEDAIKQHPFFQDLDWALLAQKQLPSPFLSHMTPLAPLLPDEQPKFGSVIEVLIHFEECDKKRQLELALAAELAI